MAKYEIFIKPSAVKELEKLPPKDLAKITKKIQSLSDNPRPKGIQKLSHLEQYRVRLGDYRIIYSINDDHRVVDVIKIGHRKEVYRF